MLVVDVLAVDGLDGSVLLLLLNAALVVKEEENRESVVNDDKRGRKIFIGKKRDKEVVGLHYDTTCPFLVVVWFLL